jgi:hypothetical protein
MDEFRANQVWRSFELKQKQHKQNNIMSPRFITKKIHAYFIDYPVAAAVIGLPFILGLGASNPLALWLSVGAGVAALLLPIFTDHHTGVFHVIPYRVHLAVDFCVGALFLVAPMLFGFTGIDAIYYWANSVAVFTAVSMSKPESVVTSPSYSL